MSQHIVCVVGNPNCGKTTFFNALTGSRQRVGNWPGVTVDKKTGNFEYRNEKIELVDLPGIYSITPAASSGEDERVARDYILSGEAEAVINIVDASNLERNLYLTAQLIEMRVPMIVVVNMLDIAKQHRLEIRLEKLQEALGCPVVGIVASRETGLNDVKDTLVNFLEHPTILPMAVEFDEKITKAIAAVSEDLKKQGVERAPWFASQFMERAPGLEEKLPNVNAANVEKIVADLDMNTTATSISPSPTLATTSWPTSPRKRLSASAKLPRRSPTRSTALSLTAGSACRSSFSSCT